MKIVVLDGYTENPGDLSWEGLEALGMLTVYDRTPVDKTDEIIHRIGDAEIVVTNKTPVTEQVMEACPGMQLICVLATGYNVVDTASARSRESRSAMCLPMGRLLYPSLPLRFCWRSATMWVTTVRACTGATGRAVRTGATGNIL